ncbi:hypothetical protein GCM10023334_110910 [Nonomuraea thailandensis]
MRRGRCRKGACQAAGARRRKGGCPAALAGRRGGACCVLLSVRRVRGAVDGVVIGGAGVGPAGEEGAR